MNGQSFERSSHTEDLETMKAKFENSIWKIDFENLCTHV